MTRPLARIEQASRHLAQEGRRTEPLAETGPREIARLAHGFNTMVARIDDAQRDSLTSQAQELVGTVAVFKLSGGDPGIAATRAKVRSTQAKTKAFKGQERRESGVPKGAAARAPAVAKAADENWETF